MRNFFGAENFRIMQETNVIVDKQNIAFLDLFLTFGHLFSTTGSDGMRINSRRSGEFMGEGAFAQHPLRPFSFKSKRKTNPSMVDLGVIRL